MKLRLPLYLLGCVLSLPLTMTASADTVGSGVFYDVGKISFSSDENAKTPEESEIKTDKNYCWAAAGSNVMQYWQDSYLNKADHPESTPNKFIPGFEQPYGTDYLSIYNEVLKSGKRDETGWPEDFFKWWFKGDAVQSFDTHWTYYDIVSGQNGYYKDLQFGKDEFGEDVLAVVADYPELESFTQYLQTAFETQGQAVALTIIGSDKETGEGALYHAISCWGYELDEQGLVSSLILSDSDDKYFGTFKVDVNPETLFFDEGYSMEDVPFFSTEDQGCYYKTMDIYVSRADYINTPNPDQKISAQSEIPTDGAVMENTRIGKDGQTVTGHGVTVGNGETVVVLTSERGAELTLDGTEAPATDTGLKVTAGAMVSLVGGKDKQSGESVGSVIVNHYQNGGMELTGKAYINDEKDFKVSDNTKDGDGAGIYTDSYLEIRNNDNVTISGNKATGKGGGIYNTGTVSIRGNESVEFSGNTAAKGNDIYNAQGGIVNIADNGSVTFIGEGGKAAKENVSIVNEGELYLAAKTGDSLTFCNSALETTGTTYIGRDISDSSPDTAGQVLFTDASGNYTSIRANQVTAQPYAMLEKLNVAATEIMGAGEENGIVSNAIIASLGGMTMKNLTLDTTDSINSMGKSFIEFDNVVLTLNMDDMQDDIFDLTGVFSGNLTMTSLMFDLSETTISGESLSDFKFDLSTAFAEREKMNLMFKTFDGKFTTLQEAGSQVLLASEPLPEPTTSTLSLLALAGLAARRRRK